MSDPEKQNNLVVLVNNQQKNVQHEIRRSEVRFYGENSRVVTRLGMLPCMAAWHMENMIQTQSRIVSPMGNALIGLTNLPSHLPGS